MFLQGLVPVFFRTCDRAVCIVLRNIAVVAANCCSRLCTISEDVISVARGYACRAWLSHRCHPRRFPAGQASIRTLEAGIATTPNWAPGSLDRKHCPDRQSGECRWRAVRFAATSALQSHTPPASSTPTPDSLEPASSTVEHPCSKPIRSTHRNHS
jgi:hypothetical protein